MIDYICASILFLMGWKFPNSKTLRYFSSRKKKVLIYTHTSYFDFIILCLYKGVYPEVMEISYAVNENYYNKWKWFFSSIGCVPATDRSSGIKKGFVSTIVDMFKTKDEYSFSISPEGTLSKSSWKGGYYYIVDGLNKYETYRLQDNISKNKEKVYIAPVGLNYETHTIYFGKFYDMDDFQTRESIEPLLQKEMEKMVPLYPDYSYTPSTYHTMPTLVDYPFVTTYIGGIFVLNYLLSFSVLLWVTFLVGFVIALVYHYTEEEYFSRVDVIYSQLWIILYSIYLYRYSLISFPVIMLASLTGYLFYKGYGRMNTEWRTNKYLLYHSLFHLSAAVTVVYSTNFQDRPPL